MRQSECELVRKGELKKKGRALDSVETTVKENTENMCECGFGEEVNHRNEHRVG